MSVKAIESRLFPPARTVEVIQLEPDWAWVHQEMRKKSVTPLPYANRRRFISSL
ncbi:MAG: hypothetical protein WCF51_04385 [Nitrosomonadaceae bacterium]